MQDSKMIGDILETTTSIAVVGFSSRQGRAGYYVPSYMQEQGYQIIPVNPNIDMGLGVAAYPDLLAIEEKVDLVLVFRRPEALPAIAEQAIVINASALWMQLGIVNEEAAKTATTAGLDVVMDACIMVEHRRFRSQGEG